MSRILDHPGCVRADEAYTRSELMRRLGWGVHAVRQAKRRGLKVKRFGSTDYVLGADILQFLSSLESTSINSCERSHEAGAPCP